MNIVDSPGWLEYLADGDNAELFAPVLSQLSDLIVPSISVYEVVKRVLQQRGEGEALQVAAMMQQAQVVPLDAHLALDAAKLALELKLPMADAIMLATARAYGATLWTQDGHFCDLAEVKYIANPRGKERDSE